MTNGLRVLIVAGDEDDAAVLVQELRRSGCEPGFERVDTPEGMGEALDGGDWDAVIADGDLPYFSPAAAFSLVKGRGLDLPCIVVSDPPGEEAALQLMGAGAHDYVPKSGLTRLCSAIERELLAARERHERRQAESDLLRSEEKRRSLLDRIAEQRLAGERAQQAARMEPIGRLAGGVAHGFNNLLTVVNGYAELVARSSGADLQTRTYAEEILNMTRRAADLTQQLQAFGGRQSLQLSAISLNDVVSDMEGVLRRTIGDDVALVTRLDERLENVRADRAQVELVLMNLAANARDAMPQGGRFTVETANADVDSPAHRRQADTKTGPYATLVLTDTGLGMDKGTLKRVFEPFFTTKEVGKGEGLGLSTAYGIVAQHGGYITARSQSGKGSVFSIYLPRMVEPAPETRKMPAQAGSSAGGETILLAEDEDGVRVLVRHILEERGYAVLDADCADAAEKAIQTHGGPFDLLLTDVVMPGRSGRELYRALRALYMSGYAADAIAHHGVLEPGIAFLQKPFTGEALAAKVRDVLDAPVEVGGSMQEAGNQAS